MDGSMFKGIGDLFIGLMIAVVVLLCFGLFAGWKAFKNKTIESKVLLVPTVKYTIHNNKLDSVFVYREN